MSRRWLLPLLVISAVLTGNKLLAQPALEPNQQANLQRNLPPTSIVFMRYYDDPNTADLMVLNPETQPPDETILAAQIVTDQLPRWKPQGGVVLFAATQDKNQDIFTVRADGQKLTNLTKNPALDTSPVWSPDGKSIAFASDREKESGLTELYVMDADGSNVLRITRSGAAGYATDPAWSPDGNTITYLFHTSKDAKPSLNNVNPTGTREAPLIPADDYIGSPAWSPNGKFLAIARNVGNDCELLIANADGSALHSIAHFPRSTINKNVQFEASSCRFNWSANSFAMVYSAPSGDPANAVNDLFVVEISGAVYNLTNSPSDEQMPTFSPDGSQIVFSSNQIGTYNLFSIKVDGTGLTRYTSLGIDSVSPVWGWTGPIEF